MPGPSPEIIQLLSVFSVAFTAPTFAKVLVLIFGTILTPGRRTVTAALRMMGLGADPHYSKYHRVLNRDRWSPWLVSKIMLNLIVSIFIPAEAPLLLVIDETLERRRGKQIKYKVCFKTRSCRPESTWSKRWAFVGFVWRYWCPCPGASVPGHYPS